MWNDLVADIFRIKRITRVIDFKNEFISLTDIAKFRSDDPNNTIRNCMRSKETIIFLGLWEKLHNPNFKPIEFEGFKNEAGPWGFHYFRRIIIAITAISTPTSSAK